MKFPVPNQLIMNKTETVTKRQVQDKNREQPFQPDPYFRPPPRLHQIIYNLKVQKLTQLLKQK